MANGSSSRCSSLPTRRTRRPATSGSSPPTGRRAAPHYQHAGAGERRRLVARQPQHRFQHQTRGRRSRADLYSRSRRWRRGAAPHRSRHWSGESEVAPRRQGHSVRIGCLSPTPWMMRPTEKSPPSARPASTTSVCMSTSRCASGTSGWTTVSRPLLVQPLEPGAKPKDILSATALAHSAGFSGVPDSTSAGSSLAAIWSPDGKEVVFTATIERWNAASGHVGFHLYRMRPRAVAPSPAVVTPLAGEYDSAQFSADGKALFFKYAPAGRGDLSPAATEPRFLARAEATPPWWRATSIVSSLVYAITSDSHTVYLLAPEGRRKVSSESGRGRQTNRRDRARGRRLHRAGHSTESRQARAASPATAAP